MLLVILNVLMKVIRIDDNAHDLLNKVKEKMKEIGIENPSFSDAIRWLFSRSSCWDEQLEGGGVD